MTIIGINKILSRLAENPIRENVLNFSFALLPKHHFFKKKIDVLVYKLYELTYDEVKIIDKDFWLSKEEYEKIKASEK